MRTENIPRKLYTTQLCRKDENGVIKFVAPNEVSRLATQEEFDKALANLNYKNPLIATWDSFEEAQHFAAKYGSFGYVAPMVEPYVSEPLTFFEASIAVAHLSKYFYGSTN